MSMGIRLMTTGRPKVFLSHITEEAALATILKTRIQRDFLNLIDVFQSSDSSSVQTGERWLDSISGALQESEIVLVLCSPTSIKRPWINFETGAGWVKGVPVIPICHTGMRPVELPLPLNLLQGIEASRADHWPGVYQTLATRLGSHVPDVDFTDQCEAISVFERDYGFLRGVRQAVSALIGIDPQFTGIFSTRPQANRAHGDVREEFKRQAEPHLAELKSAGLIDYDFKFQSLGFFDDGSANTYAMSIVVQPSFYEIADKVEAKSP